MTYITALFPFSTLLVIVSAGLSALFILLLEFQKRREEIQVSTALSRKLLFSVISILFSALLAVTIIDSGPRQWYWFALQGALLVLIMVASESIPTVLFGLLLASISAITVFSIIMAEGIAMIGIDQWRDYTAGQMIVNNGNLATASSFISNPYYASLPVLPALLGGGGLLTAGVVSQVLIVFAPVIAFLATLACLLISMRFPNGRLASVVSVLLVLSNPRLTLWEIIPSIFSITLAAVLILIFYSLYTRPRNISRMALMLLLTGVLITTMVHPAGTIGIISLCIGLVFVFFPRKTRSPSSRPSVRISLYATLALIAILYLDVSNLLNFVVSTQVIGPLINLFSFRSGPRIPLYEFGGEFATISWAVPVALAFSFLFARIVRRSIRVQSVQVERYVISCALIGLLLVIIGFLQRGSSAERYISTPGYLLLIFPASFTLSYIFNLGQMSRLITLAVIAVLITSGSLSLGWSPDSYPNSVFEFSGQHEYVVASDIAHFAPNNPSLGAILSVSDPLTSILTLNGRPFTQINPFYIYITSNRQIDSCALSQFTNFATPIFVISSSSLSNSCRVIYDVVSSSGEYAVVAMTNTSTIA